MDGLIAALRDPRAYPHAVDTVRLVETHISWVLLAGEYAYKIKKPVALEFLDFSTLAARRHFCAEELRINRRFAPGLYLDVVPIVFGPAGARVSGEGAPVEYAVRMHRFGDDALLATRVAQDTVPEGLWRRFGADLARLQDTLPRSDRDDPDLHGVPARLRDAFAQNFRQIRVRLREAGDIEALNTLERGGCSVWRQREQLMWRRYEAGRVREGHGDLHLGNIVVIDGQAVAFDAVEFNADFRWIDVLNELAFLLMDCRVRGIPERGWQALDAWLESSGDFASLPLLELFVLYRALVRAKVALMGGAAGPDQALAHYREYAALAADTMRPRRPWMAITCGVSGSGKSTLAAALCEATGAVRLRADVERKRLFGLDAESSSRAAGLDIYTADAGTRTFDRLAQLAEDVLSAGFPVVVDATFIRRSLRERFRTLAGRLGVPFRILLCSAPEGELRKRVATRVAQGSDASEADTRVLESQLANVEWPAASDEPGVIPAHRGRAQTLSDLLQSLDA